MQTLQVGGEYTSCLVGNCRKFESTVRGFGWLVLSDHCLPDGSQK